MERSRAKMMNDGKINRHCVIEFFGRIDGGKHDSSPTITYRAIIKNSHSFRRQFIWTNPRRKKMKSSFRGWTNWRLETRSSFDADETQWLDNRDAVDNAHEERDQGTRTRANHETCAVKSKKNARENHSRANSARIRGQTPDKWQTNQLLTSQ